MTFFRPFDSNEPTSVVTVVAMAKTIGWRIDGKREVRL
jgi:hypothetical protein